MRYRAEGKQIEEIEKSTAQLLETRPSGQISAVAALRFLSVDREALKI